MKKIIFALCILFVAAIPISLQAQQVKFYYYPKANVYYDPSAKRYIYLENGNWTTVQTLPKKTTIFGIPRVEIFGDKDSKIWEKNSEHVVKYKYHPNGKAVGYKGTNPNKAQGKTAHQKAKHKG